MIILSLLMAFLFGTSLPVPQPIDTVAQIGNFSCPSLTGFTFEYPLPDKWSVSVQAQDVPEQGSTRQCAMYWQHADMKFSVPPLVSITSIQQITDQYPAIANPKGAYYIHDSQLHAFTFYGPTQAVTVNTATFSAAGDVQTQFEDMLVQTFAWEE